MSISMVPFENMPSLAEVFPNFDELFMLGTSKKAREIIARLWLTEGIPFAFRNTPAVYEELRGWLASNLDIHPKEITLIRSARLGYPLKKPPIFWRLFNPKSDLDLSIISADLFARLCVDFKRFEKELVRRNSNQRMII